MTHAESTKQWKQDNRERVREHHRRWANKNREKLRAARRNWYHKNKRRINLQIRAQAAANKAIKRGDLVRPAVCPKCGKGFPEAHHHKGYEPEYWLDVVWLCKQCHADNSLQSRKLSPEKKSS